MGALHADGEALQDRLAPPELPVGRADRGKGIRVGVRATGEDGIAVEAHSNLRPIQR
jgi:hypothetical protein